MHAGDIAGRPREACHMPAGDRVIVNRKHDNWHRWRGCAGRLQSHLWARGQHNVHFARSQLAVTAFIILHVGDPHEFKSEIRALLMPELGHALFESKPDRRSSWLGTERTDTEHLLWLLRARRDRPTDGRAAEQRYERAPLHSITSSARASNVGGTSRASAFAALRLIASSYFVGACTGRSAGFAPLRMRSTYSAAGRDWLTRSGPYDISPPALTNKRKG